jgi:Mn-dependent DtxR family transcriptional regulator
MQSKIKNSSRHRYTSSQEDYLEAIHILAKQGIVRSIDIAVYLSLSKASVSRSVSILLSGGLISVDDEHAIRLTDEGRRAAEEIYAKHLFFKDLLKWAGLDEETADREACLMEHALSNGAFAALKKSFLNLQILRDTDTDMNTV